MEVAQGEVRVLKGWLFETKMSYIKPFSLMSISSGEITEAFSRVQKMSIETQNIEDENSIQTSIFNFMSSSGEHERKFKEELEAAVFQKELTIKNSDRETVRAFLHDEVTEVNHVFLNTQLDMVELLLSKASGYNLKINEKNEYLNVCLQAQPRWRQK